MDTKVGAITVLHAGTGYAGHGEGVNNPDNQHEQGANAGPLPQGIYTIGPEQDYTVQTGANKGHVLKDAMTLAPGFGTDISGRSGGFLIHGSNDYSTQDSSQGCIVLRPGERNTVGSSGITNLEVVE